MKQIGRWTYVTTAEYVSIRHHLAQQKAELLDTTARAHAVYTRDMIAEERRRQK